MAGGIVSQSSTRNFTFTVSAVSLIGAKAIRIYAHLDALTTTDVVLWGPSFFLQDAFVLLILFPLLEVQLPRGLRKLRIVAVTVASGFAVVLLLLAAVSISFFVVSGSELQWHNISVAVDASWWAMLPSGLSCFALVLAGLLLAAAGLQEVCYKVADAFMGILQCTMTLILPGALLRHMSSHLRRKYAKLEQYDMERTVESGCNTYNIPRRSQSPVRKTHQRMVVTLRHIVASLGLEAMLLSMLLRPPKSSLAAMSWTLPLLPIVDFAQSQASRSPLVSAGAQTGQTWVNKSALVHPIPLPWLPTSPELPGFEDWYGIGEEHYFAAADPLKISNLNDKPLAILRDKLKNTVIQHVVLIVLESHRKDVFPIKKNDYIWDRLANSFDNKSLPVQAQRKLATLTPNANFLTGDYNDGFEHDMYKRRGGINVNNAHTTSTYTLKSLTGTLCGVTPLVIDFNAEQAHHIYQPCLPHVLQALNQVTSRNDTELPVDLTLLPWRALHMQSATMGMDKQDSLMSAMGYGQDDIIGKEYLQSDSAKFGKVSLPNVNYFSLPEDALEDYIREVFAPAEQNKQRVFLSHLTSTTHHDFGIPETEQYVPLAGNAELDDLSHYINAVGYSDRWLGKILQILEDSGVANQTLVVLVGDHGLPIIEGSVSTYGNSNTAGIHVPLVFSHPHLPCVNIDDAATSMQILPTVLDLLIESGSVSKSAVAALKGLVQNYEGQSLLRPLRKSSDETGQGDWQYSVLNPGGSMLSVRDARRPRWHLIVPLVDGVEWRFADLDSDPHEQKQIVAFDFETLRQRVMSECDPEAGNWAEEAAVVSRWWVEENKKRWRHGPYALHGRNAEHKGQAAELMDT